MDANTGGVWLSVFMLALGQDCGGQVAPPALGLLASGAGWIWGGTPLTVGVGAPHYAARRLLEGGIGLAGAI